MEHRLNQTMENPGNIEYQKMESLNPTERLLYQKLEKIKIPWMSIIPNDGIFQPTERIGYTRRLWTQCWRMHNSTCTLPNNLGSLSKVDILNVALALVKCSSDNWSSPGALAWKREGPVISIKFQVMYSRLEICFFKSIFIQLPVVLTTGFDKNWRIYRNTAGPFFPLSSIYSSTLSKR